MWVLILINEEYFVLNLYLFVACQLNQKAETIRFSSTFILSQPEKTALYLKLTNLLIFWKITFFKGKKMVTLKKENDNFFLLF